MSWYQEVLCKLFGHDGELHWTFTEWAPDGCNAWRCKRCRATITFDLPEADA